MNIKEASEQIKGAIRAYFSKDEHGLYRIPFRMQRPVIMLGPPGVGKTAIVEQIAGEMGINFVSYSITHHTRQSALGLPFISKEKFDGKEYSVSEYTMSEIVAAVYRAREESGVKEGVLFLDEVNCVSETLAPAMLQFLQYKTFGTHCLPEGWVIVTAGNPPEYNRSAREFDAAMLDRLLKIEIEPDLAVWQEYAAGHGIHPAVTTYLEAKPNNFYRVRAAARGSKVVTSRGWEDLSRMLQAYEAEGMDPPATLAGRYLQDDDVSEDFSAYYELFRKYEDDYKVSDILAGKAEPEIAERAGQAPFDERIVVVGLMLDATFVRTHMAMELEEALKLVRKDLLGMKADLKSSDDPSTVVSSCYDGVATAKGVGKRPQGQVGSKEVIKAERLRVLAELRSAVAKGALEGADGFEAAKGAFNAECRAQASLAKDASAAIDNGFKFLDEAFGDGSQESLIYVTKLSADPQVIRLVSEYGSAEYMKHNKSLMFNERGIELLKEIKGLE